MVRIEPEAATKIREYADQAKLSANKIANVAIRQGIAFLKVRNSVLIVKA